MKFTKLTIFSIIGILILAACATPAAPTPEVIYITPDAAQQTAVFDGLKAQALQTVQAEQTQIALNNPADSASDTQPTEIPVTPTTAPITPTAIPVTPTAVIVQPTTKPVVSNAAVATANPDYNCALVSSSPEYRKAYVPGGDFDAHWTIKNTGATSWGISDVDFFHITGPQMHTGADLLDLSKSVAPGETIEFVFDMVAPAEPGLYQDAWGLRFGTSTFCVVTVNIEVK